MSNCRSFRQNDDDRTTPELQAQDAAITNAEGTEVQPGVNASLSPAKKQRFKLERDEEEASWELPESNVRYIYKYMGTHNSEKDIKESILLEHPVQSNVKKVPELDSYIKNLLNDNSKFNVLKIERTLKGIQDKVHSNFGPLSKIWCTIGGET